MSENQQIKVHAKLNPEYYDIGGESFWVTPTSEDTFIVDNILLWAPIGLGDEIRVIAPGNQTPLVSEVVKRSPRITIGLLAHPEDPYDLVSEAEAGLLLSALVEKATTVGCKVERFNNGLAGVVLPESVTLETGIQAVDVYVSKLLPTVDPSIHVSWHVTSCPEMFTGNEDGDFDTTPDDVDPSEEWNPALEPLLEEAFDACEDIPGWLDAVALKDLCWYIYCNDTRARAWVDREGRMDDVLTMALRIAILSNSGPLPPLDGPLFQ